MARIPELLAEESSLEVDSSVPLTHHDPKDLGLICLVKKRKICFRILSDFRIQSWIFLKKRTLRSSKLPFPMHEKLETLETLRNCKKTLLNIMALGLFYFKSAYCLNNSIVSSLVVHIPLHVILFGNYWQLSIWFSSVSVFL